MEQKTKSKQALGTKLSDRDVQFTNAIRKAEAKNSNETKNMKKSIEQLFREHQQVMKNLKRERTNLVRRWNLRRQESTLMTVNDSPKTETASEEQNAVDSKSKEQQSDVRLPYIKVKEQDHQSTQKTLRDSLRNSTTEKAVKTDRTVAFPQTIDKRSNERKAKSTQSMPQLNDNRTPGLTRNFSVTGTFAPSSSFPSKRSRSISYESGLSILVPSHKRIERNLSVDALQDSYIVNQPRRKGSKYEMKSFFHTEL